MSLKIVPFESLGTVSYSHSIATMAVSLAVSTQYMNMTDRDRQTDTARWHRSRLCIASRGNKNRTVWENVTVPLRHSLGDSSTKQ